MSRKKKYHRKDGYVPRTRVQLRIDDETIELLDDIAEALLISRAHFCDLILAIAVDEGGDWLVECIRHRLSKALATKKRKY